MVCTFRKATPNTPTRPCKPCKQLAPTQPLLSTHNCQAVRARSNTLATWRRPHHGSRRRANQGECSSAGAATGAGAGLRLRQPAGGEGCAGQGGGVCRGNGRGSGSRPGSVWMWEWRGQCWHVWRNAHVVRWGRQLGRSNGEEAVQYTVSYNRYAYRLVPCTPRAPN